jgi:hypothetical protein
LWPKKNYSSRPATALSSCTFPDIKGHEAATAQRAKVEAENAALKAEAMLQRGGAAFRRHVDAGAGDPPRPPRPPPVCHAARRPVPFDEFDSAWCAAVCGDNRLTTDVDVSTGARADVKLNKGGLNPLTLRCAQALPRRLPAAAIQGSDASDASQLPSYRIIIEAYTSSAGGAPKSRQRCDLGFVPSHAPGDATAVGPVVGHDIVHYGGWRISVTPLQEQPLDNPVMCGWTALPPRGADVEPCADTSAYATTVKVPPVQPGGGIEFAVDYSTGTCRVAFYIGQPDGSPFVAAVATCVLYSARFRLLRDFLQQF